jgi:hypothetical protein
MKTKETIYTEYDARGRVVRRTATVEVYDDDRELYPEGDVANDCVHRTSSKRIREAIDDYRMSKEW